jgi:protocatechuate 3,4-dioxygenase beta subunit
MRSRVMRSLRGALVTAVVGLCVVLVTPTAAAAPACRATVSDGAGPFGRGSPPARASIGKGHVLTGVILSSLTCTPIAGARVEVWQANAKGQYVRALSGTVRVDRTGRFRFESPYPVSYEGRSPHIHLRVVAPAHDILLTRYEPARGARRGSLRLVLVPQAV